jgi:hypothetical protein
MDALLREWARYASFLIVADPLIKVNATRAPVTGRADLWTTARYVSDCIMPQSGRDSHEPRVKGRQPPVAFHDLFMRAHQGSGKVTGHAVMRD